MATCLAANNAFERTRYRLPAIVSLWWRAAQREHGTGQLQKLLDLWRGEPRPNAQPGFGLPEVFRELATLMGRLVPDSEREARTVLAFYRLHGPLPREPFLLACARTANALGQGRPLAAYLDHIKRHIAAHTTQPDNTPQKGNEP